MLMIPHHEISACHEILLGASDLDVRNGRSPNVSVFKML